MPHTLKHKPDLDECLARVDAWYEHNIVDRPPVRFHHHNIEYERHRTVQGPWKCERDRWLDVEFQVRAFIESLDKSAFLGETFPVFWPNLSAVVYNLFLGQEADFDEVTAWTHPCIQDLDDLPELKVHWNNLYFQTVEKMTHHALERADGMFMVGYTDMYAGIDCTMGLRGTEQMCLDMVEKPAQLLRLIDTAFAEYANVYKHYDKILKSNGQHSVTWMNLPSNQTFNVLACDFAVNISPRHFDEYCMPVLRKEAELFVHNVFHMDGPGVAKNIDSILTLPNLKAVQWAQGCGRNQPIRQWIPLIRKIQKAGKSVIVDIQLDELGEVMQSLDPAGIMLWIPAAPNDQQAILDAVKGW